MAKLQKIEASDIFIDPELQVRSLSEDYVDNLIEVLPLIKAPIILYKVTDKPGNRLFLADGLHRLSARLRVGQTVVDAEVFVGKWGEALEAAVVRNNAHGHNLSMAEKKGAIRKLLKDDPRRSDAALAKLAGLTDKTVKAVRLKMEEKMEIETVDSFVGLDGIERERKQDTSRDKTKDMKLFFNFPTPEMCQHVVLLLAKFMDHYKIKSREAALENALIEAVQAIPTDAEKRILDRSGIPDLPKRRSQPFEADLL